MTLLITLLLLNLKLSNTVVSNEMKPTKEVVREIVKLEPTIEDSLNYCNEAIERIKIRESFCKKWYRCPAGYLTIGYGHALKTTDTTLAKLDSISIEQADSILYRDFTGLMHILRKDLGYEMPVTKIIAMTCFCFSTGIGYYNKNLSEYVETNTLTDSVHLNFCKYKSAKTGKYIRSELLYKARQWEWDLYSKY